MRYAALLFLILIVLTACQPASQDLTTPTQSSLDYVRSAALTAAAALPTETPLGYIPPSALTDQALLPTETPQGYVPPPTDTPPYVTPTPMPMFLVNGVFNAPAWPGDEVVLFWDVPQASHVWIAQHTAGVWCPGGVELQPDAIYGPLPPTGYQRLTIPPDQPAALWFDLYDDSARPLGCGHADASELMRVGVVLNQVVPTATPFPAEYFVIDSYPPRSSDGQGNAYYEVAYGACVLLAWARPVEPVYLEVKNVSEDSTQVYGPLPRRSALQVCPISGMSSYTLYAGGEPGEVPGSTISIYESPSGFQYFHG